MLRHQLSLAVLATAFALFFGNADAEANHCRRSQNYNRVQVGYRSGNYANGTHSWNNAGQSHYGHGTHRNRYYGSGGQGYRY